MFVDFVVLDRWFVRGGYATCQEPDSGATQQHSANDVKSEHEAAVHHTPFV
jgi:hypothetical protein